MSLPNIFATQPTGNVPAAFLDQNFAALGVIDCVPGTVAGIDALVYTPAANTPSITSYQQLQGFSFKAVASNTSGVTFRVGVLAVLSVYKPTTGGPAALAAGDIQNNGYYQLYYDVNLNGGIGGFHIFGIAASSGGSSGATPPVRQTVLNGPVTVDGLPNFGGATGATTVTQAGTITVTAAQGFSSSGSVDRVGQITNAAWTGLSTNGTMYLWLDVAANGSCTTGSTTLAPIYQFGGTPSTTTNQITFNVQEMTCYVGNGGAAPATYRVLVGEVTVAGGVVTIITWYAIMGRFRSAFIPTLPSTSTSVTFNHNIGTNEIYGTPILLVQCTTIDASYAVGDRVTFPLSSTTNSLNSQPTGRVLTLTLRLSTGSNNGFQIIPSGGGAVAAMTLASWKYALILNRGW